MLFTPENESNGWAVLSYALAFISGRNNDHFKFFSLNVKVNLSSRGNHILKMEETHLMCHFCQKYSPILCQ